MANVFNTVQMNRPRRNTFNLSFDKKWSGVMGNLYPTLVQEVIPGDSFRINNETMIRFAPMMAPVMHRIDVYTHYFFVPNRILWDGWEQYITGNTGETPAHPTFIYNSEFAGKSLMDYFGLPGYNASHDNYPPVNALPFAAYQKIYDDYYRDENLIEPVDYELQDGDNTLKFDLPILRKRAWKHDYFTAALPFAQKGDEVTLPLATNGYLPVDRLMYENPPTQEQSQWEAEAFPGGTPYGNVLINNKYISSSEWDIAEKGTLGVNVTGAESSVASINDLRRAFRLQEWLEKNARGGTRYVESILVHFGVRSSDKRLQRAEFIGGNRAPVIISEVLQTTPEQGDTDGLGSMGGHGISVNSGRPCRYFAEEHGWIIGITSVLPRSAYQQGFPRKFFKRDRFDYFWPTFAHIGEQEILKQELVCATGDHPQNQETFGYIPRYSEYRYNPSEVSGDFRHSLNFWHLGRIFSSTPGLNRTFIECVPSTRIFNYQDEPHMFDYLWCHTYNNIIAKRPIPLFGTPTL